MRYVVWAKAGDSYEMVAETNDPVHAIGALRGAMRDRIGAYLEDTGAKSRIKVGRDTTQGGAGRTAIVVDDPAP